METPVAATPSLQPIPGKSGASGLPAPDADHFSRALLTAMLSFREGGLLCSDAQRLDRRQREDCRRLQ